MYKKQVNLNRNICLYLSAKQFGKKNEKLKKSNLNQKHKNFD